MPLYRTLRDCNPGGVYYREGQIVSFASAPDAELFAPAEPGAVPEIVSEPANPAGTPMNDETKTMIAKAGRPKKAVGAITAGGISGAAKRK